MEWRESRDEAMVYHELWDGEWLMATAWETATGAGWVDQHGVVRRAPSLAAAKSAAEALAQARVRVEVA